jgi:hypothetical protein
MPHLRLPIVPQQRTSSRESLALVRSLYCCKCSSFGGYRVESNVNEITTDDCSVEFEQGLVPLAPMSDEKLSEALLDIARYRMESYWIGRVTDL